jgi:hypothetical protein
MRALSGAIITAAALIGLGLTAQGIGTRYANFLVYKVPTGEASASSPVVKEPDFDHSQIKIHELDNPMKLCLVLLVLSALIGIAITFIGLAYHHHRRFHEVIRSQPPGTTSTRITG